ncbi:MAG TPA: class I SAM-dependent methyltransferase [Spirochaetota bacterium]|nr:class I SAM-dependent methyltransferase [Spirochaetota bacterium]HPV42997.1 class I SAM-dependent methyltransferase [Spirochaetota bacterium]
MKTDVTKLGGVPETMLYTFYMRYLESRRPDGIISDPRYEEILSRIHLDLSAFEPHPEESPLFFACRSVIIDNAAKLFIAANPLATVVSFGSGLDFRFERVDNGTIHWYDIDLPEALEIRRAIFTQSEREHFIPSSALDVAWSSRVTGKPPVLFIAEGLFMYFTPDEVKSLLSFLSGAYPGSMLVLDASTTLYNTATREGTPYPFLNRMCSLWKWSVNSARELEGYSPGISVVEEWRLMEMFRSRMPRHLKDLFASEELPGYVKEQLMGMTTIYLVKLGPPPRGKRMESGATGELPEAIIDTILSDQSDGTAS